jgi:hypothetical protein
MPIQARLIRSFAAANPEVGASIPDMALVRMVGNTIKEDNVAACFKNNRLEASFFLFMDELF